MYTVPHICSISPLVVQTLFYLEAAFGIGYAYVPKTWNCSHDHVGKGCRRSLGFSGLVLGGKILSISSKHCLSSVKNNLLQSVLVYSTSYHGDVP